MKIGRTGRTSEFRARELAHATGVPDLFEVLYEEDVIDSDAAERRIHKSLGSYRVNPKKEFFLVPLKIAVRTVFEVCIEINAKYGRRANARVVLFLTPAMSSDDMVALRERLREAPKRSASLYLAMNFEDRVVNLAVRDDIVVSLDAAHLNSLKEIPGVTDIVVVPGRSSRSEIGTGKKTGRRPNPAARAAG